MSEREGAILLVEDNEDDVFVMQRSLQKADVANPLQVVSNGETAIQYLSGEGKYADRAEYPLPFIIFLDLKLPYLNGFDVLKWIRSRSELASILVVVLTSSAEGRDHERAYSMGARSYLVKPPTAEMLIDLFDSLQSYWMRLGEPGVIRRSHEVEANSK